MPGQFMVGMAASRSSVCTALCAQLALIFSSLTQQVVSHQPRGFAKLSETFVSGTVTHMSDAGLCASLKLVTHLHKHTKP